VGVEQEWAGTALWSAHGSFDPCPSLVLRSRGSSAGIATGWTAGVRFPSEARDFSLLHSVQTGSGADPAYYTMSPGGKAAGA
jgi:hypothetical protein